MHNKLFVRHKWVGLTMSLLTFNKSLKSSSDVSYSDAIAEKKQLDYTRETKSDVNK